MSAPRPIAVLAALEEEGGALARRLAPSKLRSPHLRISAGTVEGVPVVLVCTGVGKVAAAMGAQFVCDVIEPRCLLTIGLAGAIEGGGERGLLIIPSGALQHDVDARPITQARGAIAGLGVTVFTADKQLAEQLRRAAEKSVEDPGIVRSGVVLTGDQIVTAEEVRDRLLADFPNGVCVDMETAAIAQVARQNGLPWGGVRITSDAADENFNLDEVLGFGSGTAADLFDRIVHTFLVDQPIR